MHAENAYQTVHNAGDVRGSVRVHLKYTYVHACACLCAYMFVLVRACSSCVRMHVNKRALSFSAKNTLR